MRRRILGLLCALALCLGLLPVTALAAGEDAPNTLYVGNQNVKSGEDTTYWATTDSGELELVEGASDTSNNWNVKYDPSTATLTLRGASIQGGSNTVSAPYGSGIYALSRSGQPVSLTIELIGTNTITGNYGIYVDAQQGETVGTNASLLIRNSSDNGILEVSGSFHGIYVKSGTGDASLTINDASVVAKTTRTDSGYAGVYVQSGASATTSPNISLSVNGGSLTASGTESSDGILFYVGSSQATGATTSLTVSDNAIVRANGGIKASRVDEPTPSGTGIVFDGTEGTVYGNVELQKDLEIKSGETLTIPEGSTLNSNGNLTNNGTILASGGTLEGTLSNGTTPTTPNITEQPCDDTVTEGEDATFTVEASAGSETLTYQWQQSTDNGSSWTNIESETNASYTINSTNTSMNGYQYRCVVTGSGGVSVISQTATLTVQAKPASVPVTGVKLNTETLELFTGNTATLTATVEPDNATNKNVTWSSNNADVATVDNGVVTAVGTGEATITVTTADGGKTATCTVTVRRYVPPAPAKTPSEQALDKIGSADDGDTVTVSLPAGDTVLDAEVFEALAGRDVTLVVRLTGGAAWTVDGRDVPEDAELADIDMGVTMNADAIPADVVNAVTGEAGTVQLALAHDGPFGFEMTLTAPVGAEGAGLWANLYRYDEAAGRLVFQASARVGEDGTAALPFDHASQWAIVLDTVSHELPFSDVSPADWFANPVGEAYRAGLMTGYAGGSGLFGPNDELTRAQAATVLCRALGTDAEAPAYGMADVDPGAWYAGPVDWAVSSGLMVGYDDGSGRFGVDDALTREQLAVVLWRAAGSPDAGAYDGSAFSDGGDASGWAEPALAWAVKTGVLGGSDDGSGGTELRPTAAITRAEAATMLARRLATK